ncbi:GNAT family N-acetyltransferase [Streptomyces sp. C10-9-1]|uniref:GNAT family N-acetyltransferase n=1 Tax=Streptomyces sp. C10-9-1 TaxID=1859285 RepID=UPI003D7542AE
MTQWSFAAEPFDSPESLELRRDYYADVAGSYWGRPATRAEVDEGLAGDGAELLTPPTGLFVLGRRGGSPAACGGVLMLEDGRAELTRVFVRPGHRGRAGAGLLLERLEREARALGAHRMVLNTRLDLLAARALYRRHGYTDVPAYCSGPYAEVWLGKELPGGEPPAGGLPGGEPPGGRREAAAGRR